MALSKFTAFVKPTLKGFALADNPFAYILVKRRVTKRPLKCRYFARVDLFRLMSCGFVVSTLSSRQCTRILICLLSGTNCPLSFCFSSKSLPVLFYKNSLSFKGFCGSLCTAFSCIEQEHTLAAIWEGDTFRLTGQRYRQRG